MNALTWLLQRISAVVLLVVLGLHLWFVHVLPGGEVVTFDDSAARVELLFFTFIYGILLLAGFFHAFNGLFNILDDFGLLKEIRIRIIAACALAAAGLGFFGGGMYVLLWFITDFVR